MTQAPGVLETNCPEQEPEPAGVLELASGVPEVAAGVLESAAAGVPKSAGVRKQKKMQKQGTGARWKRTKARREHRELIQEIKKMAWFLEPQFVLH